MKRTGHITGSIIVAATLFAATAAIAQTPSWAVPPDNARCPSKWGAADERGSGNLMGPKSVLNAAKLIKTGEVIELAHVLHTGIQLPRKPHREHDAGKDDGAQSLSAMFGLHRRVTSRSARGDPCRSRRFPTPNRRSGVTIGA